MSQEAIDAALRGPEPSAARVFVGALDDALLAVNRGLMQGAAGASFEQLTALASIYQALHAVRRQLPKGNER